MARKAISQWGKMLHVWTGVRVEVISQGGVQPLLSTLQIGLGVLLRICKASHLEFSDLVIVPESNLISELIRKK